MIFFFPVLVVIYIVFAIFIFSQTIVRVKKYKIIVLPSVFIILILIPTWDYILGKQVFDEYCKKEAGLHIYEDIQKVDSIYVEDNRAYFSLDDGYKFVEGKKNEKYYKYHFDKNNFNCMKKNTNWLKARECISKVEISKPMSLYKLTDYSSSQQVSKFFNINKHTFLSLNKLDTNKKVAEIINYHWDMGWFLKMAGFFRGVRCNHKLDAYNELKSKMIKDEK